MTSETNKTDKDPSGDRPIKENQTGSKDAESRIPEESLMSWFDRYVLKRTRFSDTAEFTSDNSQTIELETEVEGSDAARVKSGSQGVKNVGSVLKGGGTKEEKQWELVNQVPQAVEITTSGSEPTMRIPPFGRVTISQSELEKYHLEEWITRGILVKELKEKEEMPPEQILLIIWGGGFLYSGIFWGFAWIITKFADRSPPEDWWLWTAVLTTVVSVAYLAYYFGRFGALQERLKKVRHAIGGVLQLGIAFGIPAITIFSSQHAAPKQAVADAATHTISLFNLSAFSFDVMLVAPALQLLMIGVLSGLPALLFYLFDRQKLGTLREEFLRSVVVLIPSIHTLRDAESVFGLRADAILGDSSPGKQAGRFLPHNRSIIFVTTIIVTIGWVVALANGSGKTGWPLVQYFIPAPNPFVYAFLGAYTFGILMLFRRYSRSDMKPSAYAHFAVRTITAIIITWVFMLIMPESKDNAFILACAFTIGFFPDTGLTAIFEFIKNSKHIKKKIPSLSEKFALERIDGINIYHRTRLIDEGIENMENLAHAELIELMLQTRIPLATLIDWIDQSILFLHVGSKDASDEEDMNILRKYGIRTASDLEKTRDEATKGGEEELKAFLSILNSGESVSRLKTILDAINDDEWMENIRVWRMTRFKTAVLRNPSDLQ